MQPMPSTSKYSQTTKNHFYENFQLWESKNFRQKIAILPIMHEIFRYQKLSVTRRVHLRKLSVLRDKKNFHEKSWYLHYAKSFDARSTKRVSETPDKSKNTKRGPLTNFSLLCDKKVSRFFGDTFLWFTETFVPYRWPASTLTCSQLFLFAGRMLCKTRTFTWIVKFFVFPVFVKVSQTS